MSNFQILNKGAFAMLQLNLEHGDVIKAESGAMVAMSDTLDVDGKMEGGLGKALARSFLAGEHFFFQHIKATRGDGTVYLSPSMIGDIHPIDLHGEEYILQKNGFFACTQGIEIVSNVQNDITKGLFSGVGFFLLKARGKGILFVSAYGNITELELKPGEKMIVDNGHLVAWNANMNYKIKKASKDIVSSITSGEMLVTEFVGPGKIYIQSRNVFSLRTSSNG